MSATPDFNLENAHRYFSAECFNRAWELIDRPDRTPEDDRSMLQLSLASLWHWRQRSDCTPTNLSIGCWQVARIYALLGRADPAREYGQLSLEAARTDGVPIFYQGYALEALARAESRSGDHAKMMEYLRLARQAAQEVIDEEDKKQLLADLETVRWPE